ncbi:MAG: MaoC family dehydratase N-terminal domain-containing protein [Deltaproteobacteria bacterium]|nr:MaoC family dehydratase N-terminal domain-containing protein [Deltaproteobacteria bacterium]
MDISSSFAGTPLRPLQCNVSWRHMMNYAAALGDENPLYFDDERPGGVVAHPMFCVAVTWPISERIWEFIESDDFPMETLATQVHYTEHLEIHRPIRPGDAITVQGRLAAITPHRSGTLTVLRFEAVDGDGKAVFTEHIGGLMRGVACSDEGRGKERLPGKPPWIEAKNPLWETVLPIDRMLPYLYDGCADIYFPIHTSVKFAHDVGLPGTILQGTATLALAVRELINREAAGESRSVETIACRFTGMVIPGSEIRVRLSERVQREGRVELFFLVYNAQGQKAVSEGYLAFGNS